jgi:hypothetical protein
MKFMAPLFIAVALVAAPIVSFGDELTELRFAEARTILEFRYAGNLEGHPIMTLEDVQKWNVQFADATDATIVPPLVRIRYDQSPES